MKAKSVSGLGLYVQDIAKTAAFYETLGFRMGERSDSSLRVYLNWFWMQFIAISSEDQAEFQAEAHAEPKGGGLYINIAVDSADEMYDGVIAAGYEPSSKPRDWPSGSREFVVRDPDGYKLVFFQKK
ncbi:MAG TPA: VOC family protein [Candidatus Saccharimonadales bacterium]|nr:VOC family protein [Candidatus Saccharimonadales bacterium]